MRRKTFMCDNAKKTMFTICLIIVMLLLSACNGMSVSTKKYNEVSNYVMENKDNILLEKEIEFYDYEATGMSVGGTNYGYYYSTDNEIVVPDFYQQGDLTEVHEGDEGTYFSKPRGGGNWCFVKQITDNWFYYELHWG